MKKNTRKSTALISLVLVPLNLLGLGFTGCDSQDDDAGVFNVADGEFGDDGDTSGDLTAADFDYVDPNDPFTLDPVPNDGVGPVAVPATQPLAASGFVNQPGYSSYRSYHGGGFFFLPIPYRSGYVPPHYYAPNRVNGPGMTPGGFAYPGYHSSHTTYRGSTSVYGRSSSGVSRSTGSRSGGSSVSHSSSTSRGGFGSTGHSMSSSS